MVGVADGLMYRGLAADPMRRHDRAMGDTGRYVFAVIVAHQVQDGIEDHPAPPTCNTTTGQDLR
ncbi:hypothetical protein E5345_03185 [Propionibacterium sp. NM47_B9-13]|nr:hypothetical protein [Cutibacterium modestum 28N]MCP2381733.1 hypothetical protein [Cutibacterium modestum 30N]REB73846.1 hypothetical protein CP877_10025 [Cutibacterium modestum]TGY30256.1 hypothetical protein E5345_03185 [Propionibacterium sp. NM47_B9-13]